MTPEEIEEAKHYSRWESAIEQAQKLGLVIVLPKGFEVFVDIDSAEDLAAYEWGVTKLREYAAFSATMRPSPSGEPGRFHVVLRFKHYEFSALERVAIQAALGSDRKREVLGIARAWSDESEPTIFFERPEIADAMAAETAGWEAGLAVATAVVEHDIEESMKLRSEEPRRGPWWVRWDAVSS